MAGTLVAPVRSSPAGPLGVLCIVFGGVVALSELVDLVQVAITRDRATGEVLGAVGLELREVGPYVALRAVVMLAMSAALVAVGIGLRMRRERMRYAGVVWCEVAFAVLVGRAVLWEAEIWPRLDRAREITRGEFGSAGFRFLGDLVASFLELAHASEYVSLGVLVVYPIVLLTMLTRPRLREEMRA